MGEKIVKHTKLAANVLGTCLHALRFLFPLHILLKLVLSTVPLATIYVFSFMLKLLSESTMNVGKIIQYSALFVALTVSGKIFEIVNGILETKINLQLWIKVKEDWRNKPNLLRNFGFDEKNFK